MLWPHYGVKATHTPTQSESSDLTENRVGMRCQSATIGEIFASVIPITVSAAESIRDIINFEAVF